MGFILHFYTIFGTNLLTGGPAQIAVFFAYFRVLQKTNTKRSPNGMKPSRWSFSTNVIQETWSGRQETIEEGTRQGACLPPWARPPPSWAPRCSTDVLLPPVPPNYHIRSQKPNSTTATFCTREILSWGLFWSSAGGGIDHGGPLHQLHGLSGDVWVVYFRPLRVHSY